MPGVAAPGALRSGGARATRGGGRRPRGPRGPEGRNARSLIVRCCFVGLRGPRAFPTAGRPGLRLRCRALLLSWAAPAVQGSALAAVPLASWRLHRRPGPARPRRKHEAQGLGLLPVPSVQWGAPASLAARPRRTCPSQPGRQARAGMAGGPSVCSEQELAGRAGRLPGDSGAGGAVVRHALRV
jgi:hypothetical protein